MKFNNIFYSKALQILPKLVFLVWKLTIWQPWLAIDANICAGVKPFYLFSTYVHRSTYIHLPRYTYIQTHVPTYGK
jgi:hypothetical protein